MNLAAFSIKQKVLVNLLTLAAVIFGTIATLQMRREVFPKIQVDYVIVTTAYPGVSPYEVEKLITIPIEDELKNIDGIDTFSSATREGVSAVFVELDPDISDRDRVINEIAREIDNVDLPDDAEDPIVRELEFEETLIEIAFTGEGMRERELREYVKNFENTIKNMEGMGAVDKVGWRDREVSIEVEPVNLEKYYISLIQVIQSIRDQNLNLPGGKIKAGTKELIIRTMGEITSAKGFEDIIIRTNSDGKYLYVKDIAKVKDTFAEQETIYKTDGKVSINLIPKKKRRADTIKLVDEIKKEVEIYRKILPGNVSITLINDMAFYVKRRLSVLVSNAIMGLGLLVLTLLLFLNVRVALVTALGIPFAFLTALLFMSFFDVGLNMITMFGLMLVVGMIVDDAIIVSENVYRYMEKGLSPKEAVIKGAKEVAVPVTVTILTTTAAFLPLMFITGIMGKFLRFFPMGVIFCLAASLFEALIILPSHLAEWVKPLKSRDETGTAAGRSGLLSGLPESKQESVPRGKPFLVRIFNFPIKTFSIIKHYLFSHERKGSEAKWFQRLLAAYTKTLDFSIKRRYKMCFGALLVLIGAIVFSVKVMPFDLFPSIIEIFLVKVETPEGVSLAGTNKVISEVEKSIMGLPEGELQNVTTTVGYSGGMGPGGDPFAKEGSNYAQCIVYLTPEQERQRDVVDIVAGLRTEIQKKNIPGMVKLTFKEAKDGPPVGKPIAIEVRGDDYIILRKIAEEIKLYMRTIAGIEDIEDNYEPGKEEIQVSINRITAARLGLSVRRIAETIRYAFAGGVATTMRKGGEDIEVIVKLPPERENDIEVLKKLTIPNNKGRLIKLNKAAFFNKYQGIRKLNRVEGKRTIILTASVDKSKITSVQANKKILDKFRNISAEHPGYYLKGGGEWTDTRESLQSMLKAFIIAFMLIYMILATQFRSFIQPLIIMVSVPFGIIGVIIALFVHGLPMSLMAMFGIIGLIGVVVNDSLILVDFINRLKEKGTNIMQAVREAGRVRLRPILLTSVTTIIALLPFIYGIGGEEPFLVPAAIAMAYGLFTATFLTLVIVPCVYLIIEDIRNLVGN